MVILGLRDQLIANYGSTWSAMAMFANGKAFLFGLTPQSPMPPAEILDKMLAVSILVNREIHHQGCWIIVYHDARMSALWRDWDGDVGFIIQFDEPWVRLAYWPPHEFADRAEAGFQAFAETLRAVDRRPEDTIKQTQGQKPSPVARS